MVVEVVHKHGISALEGKNHAPVSIDGKRPVPFQVTVQWVQLPGSRREILGPCRLIKSSQLQARPGRMNRLNTTLASRFEKALQSFVPEAVDHVGGIAVRSATGYNSDGRSP